MIVWLQIWGPSENVWFRKDFPQVFVSADTKTVYPEIPGRFQCFAFDDGGMQLIFVESGIFLGVPNREEEFLKLIETRLAEEWRRASPDDVPGSERLVSNGFWLGPSDSRI